VHILDFDQDIYGRTLRVHFVQRLRSETRFEGVDALLAQIRRDIEQARAVLERPEARVEARAERS
jgi:riboflavin kinase/FMN adenylyltransferase